MKVIALSVFALLLSTVPIVHAKDGAQLLPHLAAAGDVTQHSVVLWARATRPGPVIFQLRTKGRTPRKPRKAQRQTKVIRIDDPSTPAKVLFTGLQPNTTYLYTVKQPRKRRVASGQFRTPAALGQQRGLRFGVTGDSRGELAPYPSIRNAARKNLDFFINLGDTIYADFPSPAVPKPQAETLEEFRTKHQEVLSFQSGLNTFAKLRASTAWFSTIDDHEVTNDFSGGAHPDTDPRFEWDGEHFINETVLYNLGVQAFQEYNPLQEERYGNTGDPRTTGKVKLYRTRTFGSDAAIFILDARSFRDQELPPVLDPFDQTAITTFLVNAFDSTRTMLGRIQVEDLKRDILKAHRAGVTWKFVLVPEPIQNLGVGAASDRFEGYAAERNEILQFIDKETISNVVFIAADIHGTLINNLTFQSSPFGQQIPLSAFEVTTGSSAFDAPFGPSAVALARAVGVLTPEQQAFYQSLPRIGKDRFVQDLVNSQVLPLGYDPIGLDGAPINAELLQGSYTAVHTFGWTEFDIEATSQTLTVTTYGIDSYTREGLDERPNTILSRQPEIVSQFQVTPQIHR